MLQRRGRHQKLAAGHDGYVMPATEFLRRHGSSSAQLRLEAARRIVDSGMDDAAVVARLVGGKPALFLDEDDAGPRPTAQQFHGRGEPDDAPADDAEVINHCRPLLLPFRHDYGSDTAMETRQAYSTAGVKSSPFAANN